MIADEILELAKGETWDIEQEVDSLFNIPDIVSMTL
jgi:hypothetical protein